MPFTHEQVCRVSSLRGDPAALGGAVTVALCGHWEHEPPCRWPHHTSSLPDAEADDDGSWVVTVRFDAPGSDVPGADVPGSGGAHEALVRRLICEALAAGSLAGPDGTVSTWRLAE